MNNIHHVAIWVSDLERTKEFYEKYFDIKVGGKYVNEKKKYASYFIYFENSSIEIMSRADIQQADESMEVFGWAHIAICFGSRENVIAKTEEIRADGYKVLGEPRTTGDGFFEAVVGDPDGNRIELTI